MNESRIRSLWKSASYFGKGFDSVNPLINLRINPISFGCARTDKTSEVSVSMGVVEVEFS
jgi:hypothetical protein